MPQDVKRNNNLSISNLDPDWKPPTTGQVDDTWVPPDVKSVDKVDKVDEGSSLGARAWDFANKPIVNLMTPEMRAASEEFGRARSEDSPLAARIRGFASGGMEGLSNLISSQSSPLSMGLEVATAGAVGSRSLGLDKVANLLEAPGKITAAGMTGHGLYNLANEPDLTGKLGGLTEASMGAAGLRHIGEGISRREYVNKAGKASELSGPFDKEGNFGSREKTGEPVINELGQVIAPAQPKGYERPEGPWSANINTDQFKKKNLDELQYDLARKKFDMGKDLPNDRPKKPFIKDYWITDKDGKKILNPKYQFGKGTEGIQAKFKGWQEDGEGGHFALYDIHDPNGGPLDRSTVSEKSLKSAGIAIPHTPEFSKTDDKPITLGKSKRVDITEGFGGSGHPESPEYVSKVLKTAGKGEPGLSVNDTHVTYRDKSGNPIATARIVKDKDGKLLIQDLAADKDKGLLTGRAVAAISNKLKEMKATESSGTISPDATNLLERMKARASREIESPTLRNLFSGETGAVRFGPNKEQPINASTKSRRLPSDEVVGRLVDALQSAGVNRLEQDNLYSIERGKRFANAAAVKEGGIKGLYKQLGHLKGELPKVDFETTKLKPSDLNDLIDYVTNSPYLLTGEKIRAKIGLLKLLTKRHGELPQPGELRLLGEVFGDKFNEVVQMHGGLGGPVSTKILLDVANAPKAIMASVDVSAPLRQGLPLIHRKEWWGSIKPMFEALAKQENFDASQQAIKDRPGYLFGKEMGLKLTDLENHREEAYGSDLANLMPGVKRSERAYVAFLNKLRTDTFDSLVTAAVDAGHDPKEIGKHIANYVNTVTGRGSLESLNNPITGKAFSEQLDKSAKALNAVFFSPRLIASRIDMLNPRTYLDPKIPTFVRKESLKSLASIVGFGIATNSIAHAMGASVSLDPTNSDFWKAKFGNTRMESSAGFVPYLVAMSRLMTGKTTSSTTGQSRVIGKLYGSPSKVSMIFGVGDKYNKSFMENKFSPLVGLADDIVSGRAPDKNGLGGMASNGYSADVINRFVPMMVNDLIDIYKDDPNHLPLGAGAALGMGMQTYKPTPKKSNLMRISVR